MKQFFKELFCWHDWSNWRHGADKWAQGLYHGAPVLIEEYKTRYCKKCYKSQMKRTGEYYEK